MTKFDRTTLFKRMLCAVLALSVLLLTGCSGGIDWENLSDDAVVAQAGEWQVTGGMVRYSAIGQSVSAELMGGMMQELQSELLGNTKLYEAKKDEETVQEALDELIVQAALCEVATAQGLEYSWETAYESAYADLVDYPMGDGVEYMMQYAAKVKAKFGGTQEEVLETAAKKMQLYGLSTELLKKLAEPYADETDTDVKVSKVLEEVNALLQDVSVTQLLPREQKAELNETVLRRLIRTASY